MIKYLRWAVPLAVASPFILLMLLVGFLVVLVQDDEEAQACSTSGTSVEVDPAGLPGELVTSQGIRYNGSQLLGAAEIMRAGADAGVSAQGQTIGVMTAIGESTLTAVDHGDAAGPNSLGWFQQRDWGSAADELDAYRSATMFFTGGQHGEPGLLDTSGWETLSPTAAAHQVQRNADPNFYAQFWDDAQEIVAAVAGETASALPVSTGGGALPCTEAATGQGVIVPSGTWVRPSTGPITSGFGLRNGVQHNGLDFGASCGSPTMAARDGVVIGVYRNNVPPATGYGTLVVIDHGGGIVTRYAHAPNDGVLVTVGEQVTGGQQISEVGTYGQSTGCHLHFEVMQNGTFIDPAAFLTSVGVPLAA